MEYASFFFGEWRDVDSEEHFIGLFDGETQQCLFAIPFKNLVQGLNDMGLTVSGASFEERSMQLGDVFGY